MSRMGVKSLKRFLLNDAPIDVSVMISGNHGIGKSQVVAGYAKEYCKQVVAFHAKHGIPFDPAVEFGFTAISPESKSPKEYDAEADFGFFDIRLSENDVGDLKGIPYEVGGFTFFAPPHWFPVHKQDGQIMADRLASVGKTYSPFNRAQYGVIFLDELNRAPREVQQAAFELVNDRRLNGWRIPDGWRVVSAVNGNTNLYQVGEMDPALTDRFFMVEFAPSFEEWFEWGKIESSSEYGVTAPNLHPAVLNYCQKKNEAIDPSDKEIEKATQEGAKIQSRRSWARFSKVLNRNAQADRNLCPDMLDLSDSDAESYLLQVAGGFIGTVWGLDFVNFVKREYKVISAKDVLNKYTEKVSKHVSNAGVPELSELVKSLVEELGKVKGKLKVAQKNNLAKFVKDLKNEVAANFWMAWSKEPELRDQAQDWYDTAEGVKARMLEVFSNPAARSKSDD